MNRKSRTHVEISFDSTQFSYRGVLQGPEGVYRAEIMSVSVIERLSLMGDLFAVRSCREGRKISDDCWKSDYAGSVIDASRRGVV